MAVAASTELPPLTKDATGRVSVVSVLSEGLLIELTNDLKTRLLPKSFQH